MKIQELGTLAQYNLTAKVVVLNNGLQGMMRQWQESFYEERYSASEMTGAACPILRRWLRPSGCLAC